MSINAPVSLEELKKYPKMTSWFRPDLLARLLWRVIVSDLFGQYADRRLIVAALDTVSEEELLLRANQFRAEAHFADLDDRPPTTFKEDDDGAIWIDFVADLGDGFDSTFAIASLLSQEKLTVGRTTLPRGQLLVMGGDEVYPNAKKEFYEERLINPYRWAFPDPYPGLLNGPPVYAIPGNHDWYDGLVLFLAYFTRRTRHLHLGGWRTWQRRSYFALRLTEKWWIWAMDAQLADDVDQPQKDYFDQIAKNMPDGSNVILCGPEPGWLYTLQNGNKSLSVVDNVASSAVAKGRTTRIPIVLSGDTHHYSRYSANDGVTQFITSGGGGAFLHPTHQLKDKVSLDGRTDNTTWLNGEIKVLNLKTSPSLPHCESDVEACYPSKADSLKLLSGDFKFVRLNLGFCLTMGALYWLFGMITQGTWPDAWFVVPMLLGLGFWAYTKRQEGNSTKVKVASALNGLVHGALIVIFARLSGYLNQGLPDFWGYNWPRVVLFLIEMGTIGTLIGGYLFGLYLYGTSRWLDMNHNDAFSSMRLNAYRNFLRIRLKGDEATIYPIGLTNIPLRDDWRINLEKKGAPPPAYVPTKPLEPHLIEGPIVVRVARSAVEHPQV